MTTQDELPIAPLFAHWDEAGEHICVVAADGQEFSRARIAALGQGVRALASHAPTLVFIEGRNTPAFVAAYVAAMRARLCIHVLDPGRSQDNTALERLFEPLAVITTAGIEPQIRLTGLLAKEVHPDLALLLPTSGTTGSARMAKISERALAANTAAIMAYLAIGPADCVITTLKPFYSFGLSVLNTHLEAGARVVLNDAGVENPGFWERARTQGVTNFAGVPHTFEQLAPAAQRLQELSSLRFLAQAGGRLAPSLVRQFAVLGAAGHWQFFVMYGQTEASPRISYLRPELAVQFPDSIGDAIPGGRLWLADPDGKIITAPGIEGELHYAGPNVMSGYAENSDDLNRLESWSSLATGDLARRLPEGLFVITGRRSRFVKPFGLRVGLDAVEALLAEHGVVAAASALGERVAVLFVPERPGSTIPEIRQLLTERLRLPGGVFDLRPVETLPLLPNEKLDRRAIAAIAALPPGQESARQPGRGQFWREVWCEFTAILRGRTADVHCVMDVFLAQFGEHVHGPDDSFIALGGDSMAAVTFAIQLGDILGELPETWPAMSITQLEQLRETQLG